MITQPLAERMKNDTYWTTHIQLDVFREINDYLETNNLTRSQFAEQLGVTKGYISQILNGNFDHKISKLVQLLLAIGKVPDLKFVDLETAVDLAKSGPPKPPRTVSVPAEQALSFVEYSYQDENLDRETTSPLLSQVA